MLTMALLAYATETMSLNNTLEAATFGDGCNVNKCSSVEELDGKDITRIE